MPSPPVLHRCCAHIRCVLQHLSGGKALACWKTFEWTDYLRNSLCSSTQLYWCPSAVKSPAHHVAVMHTMLGVLFDPVRRRFFYYFCRSLSQGLSAPLTLIIDYIYTFCAGRWFISVIMCLLCFACGDAKSVRGDKLKLIISNGKVFLFPICWVK
jgi:hypothetical protein